MMQRSTTPSIIMISNSLDIGKRYGGAERFAAELCIQVKAAGYESSLALLTKSNSPNEDRWQGRLEAVGARAIYLNDGPKQNILKSMRNLYNICCQEQNIILHSHSKTGSLIASLLKSTGKVSGAMQTIHAELEWGDGTLPWILRQTVSKWWFGLTLNAQVGVSQRITQRTRRSPGAVLTRQMVEYIPNALSDDWFNCPIPAFERDMASYSSPVIGIVGVLNKNKGHHILLPAVAKASHSIPHLRVWIIGDGPERNRLAELARQLNIEEAVTFWGQQDHVRVLLDQMHLFAFPSLSEGLPTVLLESMARGIPVIASDIPGNRELIQNGVTGWLVTPWDSDRFTERIIYTLDHCEETRKLAQRAYQKAKEFRFSSVVPQYLRLYKKATMKKGVSI